jgi:carbonic anhydrase
MEKVFHFDSPHDHYTADACVVSCYDARFDLATRKFLKRRGITTYDHIKIAGSGKALAAPDSDSDREFVLRLVRISVRLHGTSRALIIAHNECGAYGGAPADTIAADTLKAAEVLRAAEPTLSIECYFADFDGVYRVQ